jgi:hypothetical protein
MKDIIGYAKTAAGNEPNWANPQNWLNTQRNNSMSDFQGSSYGQGLANSDFYLPDEIRSGMYQPNKGGRREQIWGGAWGIDPTKNKNDYFGFEDMQKALGDVVNKQRGSAIEYGNQNINQNRQALAERMASEGITGGSYLENAIQGVTDTGQGQIADQLGGLDIAQLQQILPMMSADNDLTYNIDQSNFANQLAKMGFLQGSINDWENMDASGDDWLGQLMGSIAGGAAQAGTTALMACDRRFKTNIEQVGISEEGIPIVTFNYNTDLDKKYRGVIAQDVEKVIPEAVSEKDGYKYVDYSKLSVKFEEV